MKNKTCKECKILKPISEFTKTKYNFRSACKICHNTNNRKYYSINKKERLDKIKEYQRSLIGRYNRGKTQAKHRNIKWNITLSEFSEIINNPCHYCDNKFGKSTTTGHGLDRKNNEMGYILNNVVVCCWHCNKIKCDLISYEEMKKIINLLIDIRQ